MQALRRASLALDGLTGFSIDTTPAETREQPPGLRGHTGGVVYFVDCGSMTKIGHTSGWIEDRLKGIATHNPYDLTLWGLIDGDQRFEREWYAEFAKYRYRNEWFQLTPEARQIIKDLITAHGGEIYE